jgi:hypothetical protein
LESEEREAATGRSRNVVHILPQSTDSVPRFLTGPLERVDPIAGGKQLVVVTADPESAIALAEAVLRLTGLGGIELFPVTTARRAARLMQSRPVLAIAGAPADLADLIRGSHLKLHDVRTLILAWADDVLVGDSEAAAALELVMTELPRDAARIVVTDKADKRVDEFVERYLRRARRIDEQEPAGDAEPISLQYVTVSAASRPAALRRLLDDLDPPSAAVVVGSDESESEVAALLRALGYPGDTEVKVARGDTIPESHAVIFYGMPANRRQLASVGAIGAVTAIALVQPREVQALRRLAGGEVKPLTLTNAGKAARDRERALRREISGVLEAGLPAHEIVALEPLLDRHDGIEIAAATLRLLERERAIRKSVEAAAASAAASLAAASRSPASKAGGFERGGAVRDREERSSRGAPRPRGQGEFGGGGRGGSSPRGRDGDSRSRDRGTRGNQSDRPNTAGGRRTGGRPARPADQRTGPRPGSGGRPPRDRS